LGTGINSQYEELKHLGYRTFRLALDSDQAGTRGTKKLIEALKNIGFIYTVDLPEGRDINDLAIYDDETFGKLIDMYTHKLYSQR
jgi:DNA primase